MTDDPRDLRQPATSSEPKAPTPAAPPTPARAVNALLPKPIRPIENVARGVALIICLSVPGVWTALHGAVVVIGTAGGDPTFLDGYIAGMNNLVLLVTGAAIALAFQSVGSREEVASLKPK